MNFRCPDQSGFQPEQTQITEESPLESCLRSGFPIEEYCNILSQRGFNCIGIINNYIIIISDLIDY